MFDFLFKPRRKQVLVELEEKIPYTLAKLNTDGYIYLTDDLGNEQRICKEQDYLNQLSALISTTLTKSTKFEVVDIESYSTQPYVYDINNGVFTIRILNKFRELKVVKPDYIDNATYRTSYIRTVNGVDWYDKHNHIYHLNTDSKIADALNILQTNSKAIKGLDYLVEPYQDLVKQTVRNTFKPIFHDNLLLTDYEELYQTVINLKANEPLSDAINAYLVNEFDIDIVKKLERDIFGFTSLINGNALEAYIVTTDDSLSDILQGYATAVKTLVKMLNVAIKAAPTYNITMINTQSDTDLSARIRNKYQELDKLYVTKETVCETENSIIN